MNIPKIPTAANALTVGQIAERLSVENEELRADLSEIFKAWNSGATLEEIGGVVNRIALARSADRTEGEQG